MNDFYFFLLILLFLIISDRSLPVMILDCQSSGPGSIPGGRISCPWPKHFYLWQLNYELPQFHELLTARVIQKLEKARLGGNYERAGLSHPLNPQMPVLLCP